MKKPVRSFLLLLLVAFTSIAYSQKLETKTGCGILFSLDSSRGYKIPVVTWLMPDAPAEAAGLKRGDLVTAADGASLKDMKMDDIVKRIAGAEGTSVKLEVERDGKTLSYTVMRKKYEYANSYYINSSPTDGFCEAISKLMNDAPYQFKHTKGAATRIDSVSNTSFPVTYYKSFVTVPGAISTEFRYQLLSTSAEILLATGPTIESVGVKAEEYANKIKTCFPDYYFDKQQNETTKLPYLIIGRNLPKGYEAPAIKLVIYKGTNGYETLLYIDAGDKTRYTNIKTEPATNDFATAVQKIINDAPSKFDNVKGIKHEVKGFMGNSTWYEPSSIPTGAIECSIDKGFMSKGCNCSFYEGTSEEDAIKAYNDVWVKLRDALGSPYCYNSEKPLLSFSIPSSAITVYNFGIKTRKDYESCPVITLFMNKQDDRKYTVKMIFDSEGGL